VIHLDTSFLVDLLRGRRRGDPGPAGDLLANRIGDEELAISVYVACELHAGAELAREPRRERKAVEKLCSGLRLVTPGDRFAPTYGKLLAQLRRTGTSVSQMDLLIATAALLDEAALVTRNRRHFEVVPGLDLIPY
jgi:predicted nucleic acid-binding protein